MKLGDIECCQQVVALHRSCGLDPQPDWVIFDELVLTSRNYIRTVSKVKPEWYVRPFLASRGVTDCSRLLEIAPNYFDVSSFPEGETKRALRRVAKAESNGNADATGLLQNILRTLYLS
jgi:pre-mRNA-splicing factor ATP-dependent RNA helicase DHX15/PRP43